MEDTFARHSQTPYSVDGSDYSDHALIGYRVVSLATPFVMQALENIPFEPALKQAYTVAEFGSADGGTSMALMSQIIGNVKGKYGDEQQVQVSYVDQAPAHFPALFKRIHGLKAGQADTYSRKFKHVFTTAGASNFYCQCLPSESLHLGFSATALHWLSHRPCELKSSTLHLFSTDENETRAFADAAKTDYEMFLLSRARELAHGGHLVLAQLAIDQDGPFSTQIAGMISWFKGFEKHWTAMLQDGKITQEEHGKTAFDMYLRKEEEFTEPLQDEQSCVYKAGLRLQSVETVFIPCPHGERWSCSLSKKDDEEARRKHARSFILRMRIWSNSTFMSALGSERSEEEKGDIVDEFFSRYEDEVTQAPDQHGQDFVQTFLVIKRE